MNGKKWYQSKTVWTGLAGIGGAAYGYFTGDATPAQAVQLGLTSLIGIFLRAGVGLKK